MANYAPIEMKSAPESILLQMMQDWEKRICVEAFRLPRSQFYQYRWHPRRHPGECIHRRYAAT